MITMWDFGLNGGKRYLSPGERKIIAQQKKHKNTCAKNRAKRKKKK